MDVNETLTRLIQAAIDGDAAEVRAAADDLAGWLEKGGFPPDHSALQPVLMPR